MREDVHKRPIFHVETGANFREFTQGRNYTHKLSKEIHDRHDRQPDFLAIWTWSRLFIENLTGEEHIILDGTPRSLTEAFALDGALEFYKRPARVVHINVSRSWSERQLLARGREDDSDLSMIGKRLDWFDNDVVPAIDFFRNHKLHKLFEINGEQTIERVHADIVAALKTA